MNFDELPVRNNTEAIRELLNSWNLPETFYDLLEGE